MLDYFLMTTYHAEIFNIAQYYTYLVHLFKIKPFKELATYNVSKANHGHRSLYPADKRGKWRYL